MIFECSRRFYKIENRTNGGRPVIPLYVKIFKNSKGWTNLGFFTYQGNPPKAIKDLLSRIKELLGRRGSTKTPFIPQGQTIILLLPYPFLPGDQILLPDTCSTSTSGGDNKPVLSGTSRPVTLGMTVGYRLFRHHIRKMNLLWKALSVDIRRTV